MFERGSIPIARSIWMSRIQIAFNSGDLAFQEIHPGKILP
jgi:hypothetical protein